MINFPFETNGKSIILGVPIHKHFTVYLGQSLRSQKIQSVTLLPLTERMNIYNYEVIQNCKARKAVEIFYVCKISKYYFIH